MRALVQGNVAVSVFAGGVETDVKGAYIPLSSLASLERGVSDAQLQRFGVALAVSLQTNLGEGGNLSTAMDQLLMIGDEVFPDGMGITFTSEAAALDDTATSMNMVFGVALIVVLLVLVALLAITITCGSLNYYSQIGLVMLIGVMAKNGILIVEFANQLHEAGEDIDSAIRPVMMTMVSTVFGGLPLILTSGAGAEARIAVGCVIVAGLGFATVFTLFLTPIFYHWIAVWGAAPGAAGHRLRAELAGNLSA